MTTSHVRIPEGTNCHTNLYPTIPPASRGALSSSARFRTLHVKRNIFGQLCYVGVGHRHGDTPAGQPICRMTEICAHEWTISL